MSLNSVRGRGRGRVSTRGSISSNSVPQRFLSSESINDSSISGVLTRSRRRQIETNPTVSQSTTSIASQTENRNSNTEGESTESEITSSISSQEHVQNRNYIMSTEDRIKYERIIQRSLENKFDLKKVKIGKKIKKYTSILNFFKFRTIFNKKPQRPIDFKCILCGKFYHAKLGKTSNLNQHLENNHLELENWIESYRNSSVKGDNRKKLTEKDIMLVKYFLTSNSALSQLKNKYLRGLIEKILPHPNSFTNSILPRVFNLLKKQIEEKLAEASSIYLIADTWSDIGMKNYLAVAFSFIYKNFRKELRVVGMIELSGNSNAECLKEAIEKVVNGYSFDKNKISGIVCDAGSAFVRLFRQNENALFDVNIENEDAQVNEFLNQNDSENDEMNEEINDEESDDEDYVNEENTYSGESEIDDDTSEVNDDVNDELNEGRLDISFDSEEGESHQDELVHMIIEVDQEIDEITPEAEDYANLQFNYETEDDSEDNTDQDDDENQAAPLSNDPDINISSMDPLNFLNIRLGTNNIPRYSCAAHKINLAVRSSIKTVVPFVLILCRLSRFASSVRRSTVLSYEYGAKKAKLRCENGTRWSSSYLMLVSFYQAYEKNLFCSDNQCPISKNKIIGYLKVLHPLYIFSIFSQKSDWHIGDLIPSLIVILHGTYNPEQERGNFKNLIEILLKTLKQRFSFELDSKIYQVAALLNTSKLELWFDQNFGLEYKRKALDSFTETVLFFQNEELTQRLQTRNTQNNEFVQSRPVNNDNQAFGALLRTRSYETDLERARLSYIDFT